jgi:hypothetical protein
MMADDYLDAGDSSVFLDELEAEDKSPPPSQRGSGQTRRASTSQGFMGMTPIQTFIISAMFFFIVCLIGFFFMMVTGKMVFSF